MPPHWMQPRLHWHLWKIFSDSIGERQKSFVIDLVPFLVRKKKLDCERNREERKAGVTCCRL